MFRTSLHTLHAAAVLTAALGRERLILALVVLVCVTVLAALDKIDPLAAVGVYLTFTGYVVGAGHEVAKAAGAAQQAAQTPPEG